MPANLCAARAESYPARPVTIVTSGPAGGPTDAIGRIIAQRMGETLGQTLVMENAPSSGGIAVRRVGRATPDGYTIALGHWGTHVIDGAVLSLPYDLVKDFEPIAQVASNSSLILSRNGVPAGNLQELIAWIKMNPGKATLANPGAGSPPHIAGMFFQQLTGTSLQFVPYRGGGPAMQDLIAGHVDLNMPQAAIALPQAAAGTIRAYAVMSKERLASAPASRP